MMPHPLVLSPETREALTVRVPHGVETAIVLGSGLGAFASTVEVDAAIPYADIPGAPRTGVAGHAGTLVIGRIGARRVAIFSGRAHGYEGTRIDQQCFPVAASSAMSASRILVTNAAGGLHPMLDAGDLMLLTDAVASLHAPRYGAVLDAISSAEHASELEHPAARSRGAVTRRRLFAESDLVLAREAARHAQVPLREGTYGFCSGPTYETRAEIAFFRSVGIDAAGMSTLPELLAARALGLRALALSCITNKARTVPTPVTHDDVTLTASTVADRVTALLHAIVTRW